MSSNWLRNRPLVYNPVPKAPPVASLGSSRFAFVRRIGRFVLTAFKRISMVIGASLLLSALVGYFLFPAAPDQKPVVLPDTMVLHYNLSGDIKNRDGAESYLAELGLVSPEITLPQLIASLDRGANDKRVKGFILTLNNGDYSLTQIEELRNAIKRFRSSGKFTKIFSPSYGEIGAGLGAYYLASAFDEIILQPVGMVSVAGIYAKMPYFRGVLDRFGVRPEFITRKEYKNAMENMTGKGMSDASREMMTSVINGLGDTIVAGINRDRSVLNGGFRALMDKGLYTDEDAFHVKLVDQIQYEDDFRQKIVDRVLGKGRDQKLFVNVMAYAAEPRAPSVANPKIVAHIYVNGAIIEHMESGGYEFQDRFADAKSIAKDIMNAAKDNDVSALLIDINSPGGSPTASETIRHALLVAKTQYKKPVYVVMRDAAASGGYWVASAGTKIFANPMTLTGSIGVLGGKFDISKLSAAYDVNWDGVQYGANAGLFAMNKGFSDQERAAYEATLDNIYFGFITRVAAGRKLTTAQVEQIAKGRVWTGLQAQSIGLVDDVGGFDAAMLDLSKVLGVSSKDSIALLDWPRSKSPIDAFRAVMGRFTPFGAYISPLLQRLGVQMDVLYRAGSTPRMVYDPLIDIQS